MDEGAELVAAPSPLMSICGCFTPVLTLHWSSRNQQANNNRFFNLKLQTE